MPAQSALFFDLSDRAKFRVRGNDRLRFLNGQLSNDVRKAGKSNAIESSVLNAKGKMDAELFLHVEGDCFAIDVDRELRETLPARFERYIIADDVQIEDVTSECSIFHILTSQMSQQLDGTKSVSANRFQESGIDLWVDTALHDKVFKELSDQFAFCDADCAEVLRIERGIPRWGRDLGPEIIPVEANLEERAIDYEKGCYIGQETISRMRMSGQRNKALCGLLPLTRSKVSTGMKLLAGEAQKDSGWITSAAHSERLGKQIALGYVKRGFNSVGSKLQAVSPEDPSYQITVEVSSLPFSS